VSDAPRQRRVDFDRINAAALRNAETIASSLLPDGRRNGIEWTARNPRRDDRRPGSCRVNLSTGKWADFAIDNARGGDLVSLTAYVCDLSQRDAALKLADSLGVDPFIG